MAGCSTPPSATSNQRALTLAKAQLGPVLPGERTQLPLAAITGGNWRDTPLIKARLAGGYCLRTAAQGPCAYATSAERKAGLSH